MNLIPASSLSAGIPRTLLAFERRFRKEDDCVKCLEQLRWPEGFACGCGAFEGWRTARGLWKCMRCRCVTSATSGTMFHGSHLPLMVWFRAMWWVTNQRTGISALGLQHALGLGSYRTAWSMLHVIRKMMAIRRRPLEGKIDVGVRVIGNSAVAIAVEEREDGVGRTRMRKLTHSSSGELKAFLDEVLIPGSPVSTDDAKTASLLVDGGYSARHALSTASLARSRIQFTTGLAKRWLAGTHQGRFDPKYLQAYLEEFSFRFNRRHVPHQGTLFTHLLEVSILERDQTHPASS